MSFSKAIAIGRTLRWYHLGFAFLWAATFAGLTYPAGTTIEYVQAFKLCNQTFVIVSILAMVLVQYATKNWHPRPYVAIVPGVLLSAGMLLFNITFHFGQGSEATSLIAGVLIGCASGFFYVLWQFLYTSEGITRTALYIPLSAVTSAVLCFVIRLVPLEGIAVCTILLLPLFASISLAKSLGEIEPGEEGAAHGALRDAVRNLWKPVFCVCSIGFVWKLVSSLFGGTDSLTLTIVLAGFSVAALVIAVVELFSERGFDVLGSYQILFPIITGAFLLPTLLGTQYAPILSGTLMFGFEVVNLLLIVMCAVYANKTSISSTYIYALGLCPVYIAMLVGDILGSQLNLAFAYDLSVVVGILFFCVYILSCTMFLVSWTQRRKNRETQIGRSSIQNSDTLLNANISSDSIPATNISSLSLEEELSASLSAQLDKLKPAEPLSQREREVALLLIRGNSVAAVSRELFISDNTVRGHAKSIYRKLGVHSKQQLIDLFTV